MALKLRKKGVFFTFIAFVFLSLLIFSITIGNNYELRQKIFVIETRVDTMNRFLSDIEEDIERGAYIAGFRSLVALEDEIVSTGEYRSDVQADFNELFLNGTIGGIPSSLLENNSFADWMDKMKAEAAKIDIVLNFSLYNVTVSQDSPWHVRVNVNLEIDIDDEEGISSWRKDKSIVSRLEIDGFTDPIYLIETNGVFENKIEKTNYSTFVTGADISNLLDHTSAGMYVAFSDAPSYLDRLEGDFSASENGIESLVDIDNLVSKGLSADDKSIVDYIYFGSADPEKYHVSGAPSWFKLDNRSNSEANQSHHELYQVTDLV